MYFYKERMRLSLFQCSVCSFLGIFLCVRIDFNFLYALIINMTHVNRMLSIRTTISSISTTTTDTPRSRASSPERAAELCSNWWPDSSLAVEHTLGMPHPLCHMCANWMPDVEDMGAMRINCRSNRLSNCGNDWPQERNVIKPLLPVSFSSVPKEELLLITTLNSSEPQTDPKLQ
jgi:hypothetical protein